MPPATACTMLGRSVITPGLPLDWTNRHSASTFGPIEPLAKWPCSTYPSICSTLTCPMSSASGVPNRSTAWGTLVAITSTSAPTSTPRSAAPKSLSMTASTPW